MKDLKSQFEHYEVPVNDTEWDAIVRDSRLVKYNRVRNLRRTAAYGTAGLLTTAAVVGAIFLLQKPSSDAAPSNTVNTQVTQEQTITVAPEQTSSQPVVTVVTTVPQGSTGETTTQDIPVNNPTQPAVMAIAEPLQVTTVSESPVISTTPAVTASPINLQPKVSTPPAAKPALASTEIPTIANSIPEQPMVSLAPADTSKPQLKRAATNELPNSFWAPNAFSPNGDGHNEVFYVFADSVNYTIDANSFELNIFTRTGQLVFRTRDIKAGWDGTMQATGAPMQPGVYIYTIRFKIKDSPKFQKGTITLLR